MTPNDFAFLRTALFTSGLPALPPVESFGLPLSLGSSLSFSPAEESPPFAALSFFGLSKIFTLGLSVGSFTAPSLSSFLFS